MLKQEEITMKKYGLMFAVMLAIGCVTLCAGEKENRPLSFVADNIIPVRIWEKCPVPYASAKDAALKEKPVVRNDGKLRITNVTVPEIYPFLASGKKTHPAVVVAPGGGYGYLAWSHEGVAICRWLQSNGFTAFLLKYRCPGRRLAARADMARAIRLIRFNAKKFNIDPAKVGVIGFSAGAHLCAAVSAAPEEPYPVYDAADKLEYRPAFTALIYPAFLVRDMKNLTLSKEFKIDKRTPQTLLIQTGDDSIKVENSLGWYRALHQAGVPCEMHIWSNGGHGYGLWLKGKPVSDWHLPAMKWFRRCAGMK